MDRQRHRPGRARSTSAATRIFELFRETRRLTDGTYLSTLRWALADDEHAVAVYRAQGRSGSAGELDIDQVLLIDHELGIWRQITAIPSDPPAFEAFCLDEGMKVGVAAAGGRARRAPRQSSQRWRARRRSAASTRSGSATTCSTAATAAPSAGRGTAGRRSPGSPGITERVELGPLVACTAFHPPGILARQAAAVDELSGGRLVAALGAGWNEEEFRAFGIPFDHHVSRFEEAFTIVRRLLAGERVTFEGRFHTVQDAVLLPPPRGGRS